MTLCSYNHEEVCYEGRNCPVCEQLDAVKELEKTIEGLEKQIEKLSAGE